MIPYILAISGTIGRFATLMIESDDDILKIQCIVALSISSTYVIQFILYWNSGAKPTTVKETAKGKTSQQKKKDQ